MADPGLNGTGHASAPSHLAVVAEAPTAPRPLLRVGDVAKHIAMSKAFVYSEISAGRLPSVLLGRSSPRVRPEDLEAYLRAREVRAK